MTEKRLVDSKNVVVTDCEKSTVKDKIFAFGVHHPNIKNFAKGIALGLGAAAVACVAGIAVAAITGGKEGEDAMLDVEVEEF